MALLASIGAGVMSAGVLAVPAQAAAAGVVGVWGSYGEIRFTAAKKTRNKLVITRSGRTITFDDRVALKAGKGCKPVKGDKTKARCTYAGAQPKISVYLLDGHDSATNRANLNEFYLYGGTGDDTVYGGSANDHLYGESGSDTLRGGAGNDALDGGTGTDKLYGGSGSDWLTGGTGADKLYGESGTDLLAGGTGSDLLSGGTGRDRVSYDERRKPVFASLNGKADDGEKGERDTITTTVESITGGRGDDVLTGDGQENYLYGGPGADTLSGGAGKDHLYGAAGPDELSGGSGDDQVHGGPGKDDLEGGAGNDHLVPDQTQSQENPPPWPDEIAADLVLGGTGSDTVDYSGRLSYPVTVDLDGQSGDDGQTGEGDTVGADVENIIGTWHDDRLTGNDSVNRIWGDGGDDVLIGLGGADFLYGQQDSDDLSGQDTTGDQADHLDGGEYDYDDGVDICRAFPLDVTTNCEN